MFEIEQKYLPVKIYGNIHNLKYPTCEQQEKLEEDLSKEGITAREMMAVMREFFASIGLPVEVTKAMAAEDFSALVGYVNSPKKN